MTTQESLKDNIEREIADLTGSINRIIETFRSMKSPLIESQAKVPQATDQLDKIVNQTEAATHQMLDKIEEITQREEEVISGLESIKAGVVDDKMDEVVKTIDAVTEKANANLNDAYLVMDALQFQDITSQQIQHAASLLEQIESRLRGIVGIVDGDMNAADGEGAKSGKDRVFDPNADLFTQKTAQSDVDSLFANSKK